jgi:hypothetical protein
MSFNIHFRGVGVFVAKGRGNVSEVLFPSAESKGPPDGDAGPLRPNGKPVGKNMKHADNSDAPLHFAGALIVGPGRTATYRKLDGRLVTRDNGTVGAKPNGSFFVDVPVLSDVITEPTSKIKLINPTLAKNQDRIATRFELDTGDIASQPARHGVFLLEGGIHGPNFLQGSFALEVTWTIDSNVPVELKILTLDRKSSGEESIVLDSDHNEVYFYSFDIGLPSVDDLKSDDVPSTIGLTDDDFKWSYALFDRVDSTQQSWQDWLRGHPFPAPVCVGRSFSELRLVPVSTCFPLAWTE